MMMRGVDTGATHTGVHRAARRFLEPIQDLLVLGIGLVLFALMVRTLGRLLHELLAAALDFRVVIAEVLFMLVMVEVVRLLIIYLQEADAQRCCRSCPCSIPSSAPSRQAPRTRTSTRASPLRVGSSSPLCAKRVPSP